MVPYLNLIHFPVLYDCETLSITLVREHGLRVFENKVGLLKKIFGAKRDEITGKLRKVHKA